jgi:hypothetical protein
MSFLADRPRERLQAAPSSWFPASYRESRERFQELAREAEAAPFTWQMAARGPREEPLAIDVARWGHENATRWLLLTTGIHGSEAPFGSAVLFRLLQQLQEEEPHQDVGILLIHALNPFGFAWTRRTNEDNIDLNRNGLLPTESYTGAHPLYHHVYHAFDPHRRKRMDSFYLQAWWLIMRHTKAALQASLPVGQYEYPRGLFFGGKGLSESLLHLQQHLPTLMPDAEEVMHLDFHTGLGRWAQCKLLIDMPETDADAQWIAQWSPPGVIESAANNRTAYHARGSLGPWMKQVVFPHARYRYAAAEFGTYGSVSVLRSLVKELQAHYAYEPEHRYYEWTKKLIRETFVPASPIWRQATLEKGYSLCRNAQQALVSRSRD